MAYLADKVFKSVTSKGRAEALNKRLQTVPKKMYSKFIPSIGQSGQRLQAETERKDINAIRTAKKMKPLKDL